MLRSSARSLVRLDYKCLHSVGLGGELHMSEENNGGSSDLPSVETGSSALKKASV